MTAYIIAIIASCVLCYLMGSVIFGVIISMLTTGRDVRSSGSGNAGATNVMRTVGIAPAILTFACDAIKCAVAMLISKYLILVPIASSLAVPDMLSVDYMQYLLGFFAMLGHSYPIFFRFSGGKAVSSSVGVMFCLNWQIALFVLLIFIVCVVLTRIVSLGSVVGAVQFILLSFVYSMGNSPLMRLYVTLLALPIGLLVIIRHSENIKRLLSGEESPLRPKKTEGK